MSPPSPGSTVGYFPYINQKEPSIMDIMFQWPGVYRHMLSFTNNVMRGPSELSKEERELIAAYVSVLNQCSFCMDAHTSIAVDFGMDPNWLKALADDPQSADIDNKLKPVLELARKVTLESARITQADIDSVAKAGWDYKTAHDTIAVASIFNFHNRMVNAHGIPGIPVEKRRKATWFLVRLNYSPPFMNTMLRIVSFFKGPRKLGRI